VQQTLLYVAVGLLERQPPRRLYARSLIRLNTHLSHQRSFDALTSSQLDAAATAKMLPAALCRVLCAIIGGAVL